MTALLQATARRLCKLDAECFGVTLEDLWAERGESYLIDAQEVVEATGAGELLEALTGLLEQTKRCFALVESEERQKVGAMDAARAAIRKATGEKQ